MTPETIFNIDQLPFMVFGGWLLPAISIGAGLLQGLTSSRQEKKNRDVQTQQMAEQKRQFDLGYGLDRERAGFDRERLGEDRRQFDLSHGLNDRRVALDEGVDRRRAGGLQATAAMRMKLIENLLQRLGVQR